MATKEQVSILVGQLIPGQVVNEIISYDEGTVGILYDAVIGLQADLAALGTCPQDLAAAQAQIVDLQAQIAALQSSLATAQASALASEAKYQSLKDTAIVASASLTNAIGSLG